MTLKDLKLSPAEMQGIQEAAPYAASDSTGGDFWADVGAIVNPVQAPAVQIEPRRLTQTG